MASTASAPPTAPATELRWQTLDCTVHGESRGNRYKTFVAIYSPVVEWASTHGIGRRVALGWEDPGWSACFAKDPHASAQVILEAFAA